jgi:uncharacterized membrane protein YfcA
VWRVQPRERLHVGWEFLATSASGFFAGFCGIGGPQLVLWLSAQRWPPARVRAFLFFAFTLTIVPQALLLAWGFDDRAIGGLALGVVSLPAALAGTAVGLLIGNRLPRHRLRQIMLLVLAIVSAVGILSPWL